MADIKKLIENPHPIYKKYVQYWNFLLDSYEGGVDYTGAMISSKDSNSSDGIKVVVNGQEMKNRLTSNLFMHKRERQDDYQTRVNMSYYYNFCAPVIDIYTNHLLKQNVVEDWGSIESDVEAQEGNFDRKGGSIEEVRKELIEVSQIYGHSFTVIDSPNVNIEILSRQDQIDNGVFPYFSILHPQNVINWALDSFGNPYWVLTQEVIDSSEDPFSMSNKDERFVFRYRLWTRNEWYVFNDDMQLESEGVHGLGCVPVICAFDKQSKKAENFLGISFIADIAFIARDIYNTSSELKQILRDQTFSLLAVQGNATDYPEAEIGTNKGLLIPEGMQMPQYITPPPGPADTLMKHIDTQVSKIFQLAKLEGGSASFGGQSAVQQSGVSKAWDFNQTNSALAGKATNIEDAESKAWKVWSKWIGKDFDGSVQYSREFNVQSLNDDLDQAERITKLNISNEFQKTIKKTIVQKKYPRMTDEEYRKIEEEIDNQQASQQGNRLSDRLTGVFNNNANQGGNNGGLLNVRRQ